VRIVGIDPGSERTGYGCVETEGRRLCLVTFGVIRARPADALPHNGGSFNAAARSTDGRRLRAIFLVACVACIAVMSTAFLVFVDDGNTPRLDASAGAGVALIHLQYFGA